MYKTLLDTKEQKVTWILISIYCLNTLQELSHIFRSQAPACTSTKGRDLDAVLSHINFVLLHGLYDYKITTKKYLEFEFVCQKISDIEGKPTRETYRLKKKKKSLGTIKRFCLPGKPAENTATGFCKMLTGYQILC